MGLDDGSIFIAGGRKSTSPWEDLKTGNLPGYFLTNFNIIKDQILHISAHLFHPLTGWKRLPDMTYGREFPMCGLVTNKAGGKKIVVAGGLTYVCKP